MSSSMTFREQGGWAASSYIKLTVMQRKGIGKKAQCDVLGRRVGTKGMQKQTEGWHWMPWSAWKREYGIRPHHSRRGTKTGARRSPPGKRGPPRVRYSTAGSREEEEDEGSAHTAQLKTPC